jgi:ABC-type uncharacterized transport system substrate-binding protein
MDALITDYTALGVKAAGTKYRLLNGTREVDIVLPNLKRKQTYKESMRYRWQTKL